jgi:uncharacterized protein (TIGR04255 family)
MAEPSPLRLDRAPIVEAVVDIHCDLPPTINRGAFHSAAQKVFADQYPEFRTSMLHQEKIHIGKGGPERSQSRQMVSGYQSLSRDKKQIVQSRFDGFSFHRLAPYESLDDYLPEIQRCWEAYRAFAQPVIVRRIALRYINRIPLPLTNKKVNIDFFLRNGPKLPPPMEGGELTFTGFTHHHQIVDAKSGHGSNVILATQPADNDVLPLVLDLEVFHLLRLAPTEWPALSVIIGSLRALKNHIFRYTLTDECLTSLQPRSP